MLTSLLETTTASSMDLVNLKISITSKGRATQEEQYWLLRECDSDRAVENLLHWLCGPKVGMRIADIIPEIKRKPRGSQPRNSALKIARQQAGMAALVPA